MAGQEYEAGGNIYNYYTSNSIIGIQIRLYDSNLSDSTTSGSNGYYHVGFMYSTVGGCSPRYDSMYEADKTQDFYVEVKDIDGTNNGQYQSIITNIGSIYNDPDKTIDFYLQTN